MKVYLAGPITGLTYDGAQEWREYAKACLAFVGIVAYSPLRLQETLRAHGRLDAGGTGSSYARLHPLLSASGMTARDRHDVRTSDAVLVNLLGAERASIGTAMEIAWADAFRVPTVVALEEGGVHDHALLTDVASYVARDLDTALECIKGLLLP